MNSIFIVYLGKNCFSSTIQIFEKFANMVYFLHTLGEMKFGSTSDFNNSSRSSVVLLCIRLNFGTPEFRLDAIDLRVRGEYLVGFLVSSVPIRDVDDLFILSSKATRIKTN